MTILVTGATGIVGARLLPRLLRAGYDCRALVRSGKQSAAGVTSVIGDILDPDSLADAVEGVSAIIHLAALLRTPNHDDIRRVNVEGTCNLIAAVKKHARSARFVMASTGLVYGHDVSHPAREEDAANSKLPYPATKLVAEQELRNSTLKWAILRFGFVYGDGDGHLQSLSRLIPAWNWHPAQRMSTVHHRDIARIMELALKGGTDGQIVNVTDDAPTSVFELANLVGVTLKPSNAPLANPWMGHMDGSLARSLGFQPQVRTVYQAAQEQAL